MSKKKKERPLYTRGYDELSEKISKGAKFLSDCRNCEYFYLDTTEGEELCQHPSVLQYDIVVDDNRIFCAYWNIVKYTKNKEEDIKNEEKNSTVRRISKRIIKRTT